MIHSPDLYQQIRHTLKQLSKTEPFQRNISGLTRSAQIDHLYTLMQQVTTAVPLSGRDILDDMRKLLTVMESPCITANFGLSPLLASHYNLCLGTIMALADPSSTAIRQYIAELEAVSSKGLYMVTEIDVGNNAMSLQTEAHYDSQARQFIINTPTPGACKFMPYLSAQQPKLAIVMARLFIEARDCGIHPFIVRCRDHKGRLLPGIQTSDIEDVDIYSVSYVDHSITAFHQVRVPHHAFLGGRLHQVTPDGKFITRATSHRETFFHSLCRIEWGKIVLTAALISPLKMAVASTVHYQTHRKLNTREKEINVADILINKTEAADAYVTAAASIALYENRKEYCLNNALDASQLQFHASIVKSMVVELSREAIRKCLMRTGVHGKLIRNRITLAMMVNDHTATAEGDSLPVLMNIAKRLLKPSSVTQTAEESPYPRLSARHIMALLQTKEHALRDRLATLMATAQDANHAWNEHSDLAYQLAWTHGVRATLDALAPQPDIQAAFALSQLLKNAVWFITQQALTPEEFGEAEEKLRRLLVDIFERRAVNAAEEWDIADLLAQTEIGATDMGEYWLQHTRLEPRFTPTSLR